MLGISKRTLKLTGLFAALPIAAIAHDVYIWKRDGNIFTLADLGGIFRHYAPDQFDQTVNFFGTSAFNAVFTPILSQPAVFLGVGLTGFVLVAGIVIDQITAITAARAGTNNPNVKSFRKPSAERAGLKDKVLYKRR